METSEWYGFANWLHVAVKSSYFEMFTVTKVLFLPFRNGECDDETPHPRRSFWIFGDAYSAASIVREVVLVVSDPLLGS
jgi:hypothetical protein